MKQARLTRVLPVDIVALFIVLAWVAAPRMATAGMLKCEAHSLSMEDEASVRAKARAILPKRARIETVGACRNPNSARAWISTRKTTSAEGVQQWWEFACQRETVVWGCDAPEFKQSIELTLDVEDHARQIELSFDQGTALELARSLVKRALMIYADPAARLPSCSSEASGAPAREELNLRNPFAAGWKSTEVSVSRDAAGHSVWLHDVSVEIGFPGSAGEAGVQGLCWDEVIVVT
jgi:hypothetical protein